MGITERFIDENAVGSQKRVVVEIDLDSSYPNPSGYVFDLGKYGIKDVQFINFENVKGYNFAYTRSDKSLHVYNGTTEISNATDLSAVTAVRVEIAGTPG